MKMPGASCAAGLLIVLSGISVPMSASAQEGATRGPAPLSAYDTNGDGVVSEAEFDAFRSARMTGRAAEGRPMRGAASAPAFADFDTNSDGQIDADELAAGQRNRMQRGRGPGGGNAPRQGMQRDMPVFADYDTNGDGKITSDEFESARAARISKRAQQGYRMQGLASAPEFSDIDANGDGAVSPTEFKALQRGRRKGSGG